jgi:hypothetical protein
MAKYFYGKRWEVEQQLPFEVILKNDGDPIPLCEWVRECGEGLFCWDFLDTARWPFKCDYPIRVFQFSDENTAMMFKLRFG